MSLAEGQPQPLEQQLRELHALQTAAGNVAPTSKRDGEPDFAAYLCGPELEIFISPTAGHGHEATLQANGALTSRHIVFPLGEHTTLSAARIILSTDTDKDTTSIIFDGGPLEIPTIHAAKMIGEAAFFDNANWWETPHSRLDTLVKTGKPNQTERRSSVFNATQLFFAASFALEGDPLKNHYLEADLGAHGDVLFDFRNNNGFSFTAISLEQPGADAEDTEEYSYCILMSSVANIALDGSPEYDGPNAPASTTYVSDDFELLALNNGDLLITPITNRVPSGQSIYASDKSKTFIIEQMLASKPWPIPE